MVEKTAHGHSLGLTARWTAAARATENRRKDPLFDDPWADALAGKEGREWVEHWAAERVAPIVLRTRFFDDFLQRVTWRDEIRQIVLMAAGLDTRAYRLRWPDRTRFFELDQAAVLRRKERILRSARARPGCALRMVEADLTGAWKETLLQAGFDPSEPCGWLLEGFFVYLPNERLAHLLEEVTDLSAHGSWMGFDVVNSITLTSAWTQDWIEMQAGSGVPWIGTMDDPEECLSEHGWTATLTQVGANGANHGRWPYPILPTKMPDVPHFWLVTAHKGDTPQDNRTE
jgi:methyltransferase (TIGR00027 family)